MSKIYKKTVTHEIKFTQCDMCGYETELWNIIDNWCIISSKQYCRKCQKEYKVGWYKEDKTK